MLRRPANGRSVWIAVGLTVFVAAFEHAVLRLPYGQYFSDVFEVQDPLGFGIRAVGALAVCALTVMFFWASLVSSTGWRVPYLLGFAFTTFVEYGYVRATGSLLSAMDFYTAFTSTQFWPAMMAANLNWLAAIPVAVYAAVLYLTPSGPAAHGGRLAAAVILLTVALHSAYAASAYLRRAGDTVLTSDIPIPVATTQAFVRSATLFAWAKLDAALTQRPRDQVSYRSDRIPSVHIVLVIDEYVEADRLSANGYDRPTTPWLETLQQTGRLTNWGVASSIAPVSDPSVLAILTGISTLPDRARAAFTRPTIFQFAKAMNYRTHLFDGQLNRPRYGLSVDDLRFVDDFRGLRSFGKSDPDTDFRIAEAVRGVLKETTGQFLVVLKRGNHYPHSRNYTPGSGVWANGGVVRRFGSADDRDAEGSYDDGLRYNVDRFFRGVLEDDGTSPHTVILYTSDHGRSYEDSWRAHAVPLMMFGDARPAVDTGYRAGHVNIFPTLLDLMGFPEEQRPARYGRSLVKARAADREARVVLSGDLFGAEAFDTEDFDRLH